MRTIFLVVPAFLLAGCTTAQGDGRPKAMDPGAKADVGYRSAFEGYQPFADQELQDWRKANDEVGAAGGHGGHRPGQGPGQQSSKPQPGKPESAGAHGVHK
jgi:hypothetical protein